MNEENEQMQDLLATRAVFGLSEDELLELERLEQEFPEFAVDDSFERAATAIALTDVQNIEPMPARLQAEILNSAERFFDSKESQAKVLDFGTKSKTVASQSSNAAETNGLETEDRRDNVREFTPKNNRWQWLGWAVAAAACVALAVNLWTTRLQTVKPDVVVIPTPTQTPVPVPNPAQEREQLLASVPDALRTDWAEPDPKQPVGVSGDIVWSDREQKGFMRLRGLPANDPSKSTYQLWIFDANQDEKTPVDGGVFDIPPGGEVIVPIDAKLAVKKPKMFAITEEKPGGVPVSKREKIVALAKVSV